MKHLGGVQALCRALFLFNNSVVLYSCWRVSRGTQGLLAVYLLYLYMDDVDVRIMDSCPPLFTADETSMTVIYLKYWARLISTGCN